MYLKLTLLLSQTANYIKQNEGEQVLNFIQAVTTSKKGGMGVLPNREDKISSGIFYILLSPFITTIKVDIIGIN
jgi:hypothetical protein